jgi:hypothetical protein
MWKVTLFGALAISSSDGSTVRIRRPKVAELIAFLALRRTPVVDRDTIVEALWPDGDFGSGRNCLRQTLALLRAEVRDLPLIIHGKNGIELDRRRVEIETETIDGRLKWFRALTSHERTDAARQLWEIVGKSLVPELKSSWLVAEQNRFAILGDRLRLECEALPSSHEAGFRFGDQPSLVKLKVVGRDLELAKIREWLEGPSSRCLTLVGPPGVGKTRLLQEATHPDRSRCDATILLTTVQEFESPWLERIGQMLGIRGEEQVTDSLVSLLAGFRHPLIALDDIDQASPETRKWISRLRSLLPDLKVLATARTCVSGIPTDTIDLAPLPTGREGATESRELLSQFAALFGVDQNLLSHQSETLGELATLLEGLPLSLEVAAGWLPFMTADRLLLKLKSSHGLVIDRASQDRASFRTCIQSICELLPPTERTALRCLSLCKGGCGEDLAEEMLGSDWPWALRALKERSLLFTSQGNRGRRFVVLQAIREAVELSEPAEIMSAASRLHQEACSRLAERASYEIDQGNGTEWLDWLTDEGDNVLAACSRSFDDPSSIQATLNQLNRLRSAFGLIGRPSEFERIFQQACTTASQLSPK